MELKERDVRFQVDCGGTVNVISQKYVHNESLEKSDTKLTMYNKTTLKPIGKCGIIIRNPTNGKKYNVLFEVVKEDLMPLLSRKAAEQMQLITVNYDKFTQIHGVVQDSAEFLLSTSQFSITVLWASSQETSLSKSTMMLNLCNVRLDVSLSL